MRLAHVDRLVSQGEAALSDVRACTSAQRLALITALNRQFSHLHNVADNAPASDAAESARARARANECSTLAYRLEMQEDSLQSQFDACIRDLMSITGDLGDGLGAALERRRRVGAQLVHVRRLKRAELRARWCAYWERDDIEAQSMIFFDAIVRRCDRACAAFDSASRVEYLASRVARARVRKQTRVSDDNVAIADATALAVRQATDMAAAAVAAAAAAAAAVAVAAAAHADEAAHVKADVRPDEFLNEYVLAIFSSFLTWPIIFSLFVCLSVACPPDVCVFTSVLVRSDLVARRSTRPPS